MSELNFNAETWRVRPLYDRARAGDGIAARELLEHFADRLQARVVLSDEERELLVLALRRLAHFDDPQKERSSTGKDVKATRAARWLPSNVFMPDAPQRARGNRGGSELTKFSRDQLRHVAVFEEMQRRDWKGEPTEQIFQAVADSLGLKSGRTVRDSYAWFESMVRGDD